MEQPARSRWFRLSWTIPVALVTLLVLVLAARVWRASTTGADFLRTYPGDSELPSWAPVGFPVWLEWQHGITAFLLLFIVRSGWLIRQKQRPPAFVLRDNTRFPRTRRAPRRQSIHVWWHLVVDTLWVVNGVVFWVLLFVTGQWVRMVPVHWDVVPNAISASIQYVSLEWPVSNGWTNYNGLQLLTYGFTVFIASPIALLSGLRLSPAWPDGPGWTRLNARWTEAQARTLHFWVLIYFVAFTIVHVTLILATGALRNLNHMYATRDDQSIAGLLVFAGSVVIMVVGWVVLKPPLQARLAARTGTVR